MPLCSHCRPGAEGRDDPADDPHLDDGEVCGRCGFGSGPDGPIKIHDPSENRFIVEEDALPRLVETLRGDAHLRAPTVDIRLPDGTLRFEVADGELRAETVERMEAND